MTDPSTAYPQHLPRPPLPARGTYLPADDIGTLASELLEVLRPPAWHRDAACKETPGVDFFPAGDKPVEPAQAVCARCLVREECLEAGAREFGVWGGMGERERRPVGFDAEARTFPDPRPPSAPLCVHCEADPARNEGRGRGLCGSCESYQDRTGRPRPLELVAEAQARRRSRRSAA